MDSPLLAAVQGALDRGATALQAASTPELLLASQEELRQVDSPYVAAFILLALERAPERLRSMARPLVRYLLEAREPSGLWRLWEPCPELPPSTSASARVLLALDRWGEKDAAPAGRIEAVLATARPDGACGAWVGTPSSGAGEEPDMMASLDVLALATHLGRTPPELASFVTTRLEAHGLAGHSRQPFLSSPFAFAHALGHWLCDREEALELRRFVWRECVRYRERAMESALDCALALTTLVLLGPPRGEPAWEQRLEEMVSCLLRQQSDIGLWPALPLLSDERGWVYGSVQLSTAACLEALAHCARRWEASRPGPSTEGEPAPALPRGRRFAATHKERAPQAHPRPGMWGDTLQALQGAMPPALLSPEALANICSIARWLPASLTDGFGIECRLAEPTPRADVFFWVNSDGFGRDILAGQASHAALSGELLREPLWRSVREFSRQWADPGSLLYQGVDSLWLEFDVGAVLPELPAPFLFFCPEEVPVPEDQAGAREARARHLLITTTALRALDDGRLSSETLRTVRGCIEALPAGSQPFAIGVMRSRRLDTLRFCVKDIPARGMLDYLTAIGWRGPHAELEALLDWLAGHVDRFVLDFDVGDQVLPSVGLECSFHGRRQPPAEPRWGALLQELVRRGLCQEGKRDALMAWPGLFNCVERVGGEVRDSRFDRRLSHLKLSLKPELEAKGYLGAWRYFEVRRAE